MIRALIIGIFSAAALTACASAPSHTPARTASAVSPAGCSTGTLITRPRSAGCYSPTRVYSADQLRTTGKTDAGHALQMLDPSVTVSGH